MRIFEEESLNTKEVQAIRKMWRTPGVANLGSHAVKEAFVLVFTQLSKLCGNCESATPGKKELSLFWESAEKLHGSSSDTPKYLGIVSQHTVIHSWYSHRPIH